MYKLLNANFYRLIKNKFFWLTIIATLIMACMLLYIQDLSNGIETILFKHVGASGIFISIFTCLFVGLEYANGTIRNKIIVGYSRIKIYLSNLIVSITVGIILEIIYMVTVFIVGIPICGGLQIATSQFIIILLNITMIIVTYSSIFNCITLLCSEITMSTIIGIILLLVMFLMEEIIATTAFSEKYRYSITRDEQGTITKEIIGINTSYQGETRKKIAQTILYIMPNGQSDLISTNVHEQLMFKEEPCNTTNLLWYSFGTIIVINAIGMYFFDKKELK